MKLLSMHTGLPLTFGKFSLGFQKYFFLGLFLVKLNFKVKTVLNSLKILKRYCKATSKVFFIYIKVSQTRQYCK